MHRGTFGWAEAPPRILADEGALEGIEWRSEGEGRERREQGGDAGQGPAKRVRSHGAGEDVEGAKGKAEVSRVAPPAVARNPVPLCQDALMYVSVDVTYA